MLLLVLGLLDILAAITIVLGSIGWIGESTFLFYLAVFMLLKGLWSVLTSAAASFFFDFMGIIDIIGAIIMFLINWGMSTDIFLWIGILIFLMKKLQFLQMICKQEYILSK